LINDERTNHLAPIKDTRKQSRVEEHLTEDHLMRINRTKPSDSAEPVGIVISDGGHGNVTSRLAAFVWGPVPEDLMDDLDALESSNELMFAAVA